MKVIEIKNCDCIYNVVDEMKNNFFTGVRAMQLFGQDFKNKMNPRNEIYEMLRIQREYMRFFGCSEMLQIQFYVPPLIKKLYVRL